MDSEGIRKDTFEHFPYPVDFSAGEGAHECHYCLTIVWENELVIWLNVRSRASKSGPYFYLIRFWQGEYLTSVTRRGGRVLAPSPALVVIFVFSKISARS